jgi:hypothetical protein
MPRIIRTRYRNVRTIKPAPSYGGPRPGSLITVRRCQGGYSLPAGIPEGARVRVIDFDRGTYRVSWKGREYQVSMACVWK